MKIIKGLLVFVLIFSVVFCFAGCKKTGDSEETTTTNPPEQNATTSTVAPVSTTLAQALPSTSETEAAASATTIQQTEKETEAVTAAVVVPSDEILSFTESFKGINHTVFYPANISANKSKLPVIAWANGTAVSYTIYEKLLIEIAKGGYVVVANDETMSADGTAQISSIDFIVSESSDSTSPLYNKVNTQSIGVAGHSQGGRSSVNAAAKDSRISCVLSLAGSNFKEEAQLLNTPTLFFAGTSDLIVGANRWVKPAYEVCKGTAVYASLKNATHTACSTSPEKYTYYAISWFDAWLKKDNGAKEIFKEGGQLSQDSQWTDYCSKGF